jgi:hypothetical protein
MKQVNPSKGVSRETSLLKIYNFVGDASHASLKDWILQVLFETAFTRPTFSLGRHKCGFCFPQNMRRANQCTEICHT